MPGDPRANREVHHLSGEDEGRHHPHQRCRSLLELPLDGLESVKEARRAQDARQRRHAGIENRVRNMHVSNPEPVHIAGNERSPHPPHDNARMPFRQKLHTAVWQVDDEQHHISANAALSRLEIVICGSVFVA